MKEKLKQILSKLDNIKEGEGYYQASCPAHEDLQPSLSISEADNKILLHCHAGCETKDILKEIGLEMQDLFEQFTTYDYLDENGKLLYQARRRPNKSFYQRRPDDNDGWINNVKGITRVPYNLPDVIEAIKAGETIYICEGEKDCNRLKSLGITATTNNGGAGKWKDNLSTYFQSADVVIIPDNDQPGREHVLKVAKSLIGKARSMKIITLPGLPEKGDVSDWLDTNHTIQELDNLVKNTKETFALEEIQKLPSWDNLNVNVNVSISTNINNDETIFFPLINYPVTEMSYLIEEFLPSGCISMIYGDGGQGKSYLALYIGVSIALGKSFIGKAVKEGKVLYIDFELSAEIQRNRLDKIINGLKIVPEKILNLIYLSPGTQDDIPSTLKELIPFIKNDKFDLIIIDSIGAALNGDPESARDICRLFQQLRQLGTVLILDHQTKKQKGDKSRDKTPFGSVYKTNLSRNVWHLSKISTPDKKVVKCLLKNTKNNFSSGKDDIGISFIFENGALYLKTCEIDEEFEEFLSIKDKILNLLKDRPEGLTSEEIAVNIDENLSSIKTNISYLKKNGEIEVVGKEGRALRYAMPNVVNNSSTSNLNINVHRSNSPEQKTKNVSVDVSKEDKFRGMIEGLSNN